MQPRRGVPVRRERASRPDRPDARTVSGTPPARVLFELLDLRSVPRTRKQPHEQRGCVRWVSSTAFHEATSPERLRIRVEADHRREAGPSTSSSVVLPRCSLDLRTTTWGSCSEEQAHRRAGGRRRHNAIRRLHAELRRVELVALVKQDGLGYGAQSRYARLLGVHRSTVSRDLEILLFR